MIKACDDNHIEKGFTHHDILSSWCIMIYCLQNGIPLAYNRVTNAKKKILSRFKECLWDGYNNTGHNKIIYMNITLLFWCTHNIVIISIIVINTSVVQYRPTLVPDNTKSCIVWLWISTSTRVRWTNQILVGYWLDYKGYWSIVWRYWLELYWCRILTCTDIWYEYVGRRVKCHLTAIWTA